MPIPQTLSSLDSCTHKLAKEVLEKHAPEIQEIMMKNLTEYLQNEDNIKAYFDAETLNKQIQEDIHAVLLNIMMRDVVYHKQILYSLLMQDTIQKKIGDAITNFNGEQSPSNEKMSLYDRILEQIKPVEQNVQQEGGGEVPEALDSLVPGGVSGALDGLVPGKEEKNKEEVENKKVDSTTAAGASKNSNPEQTEDTINNILALNARDATEPYINKKIFNIYLQVMRKTIQTKENQKEILKEIQKEIREKSLQELTNFMNGFGANLHLVLLQQTLLGSTKRDTMRKLLEDVVSKYQGSLIDPNGNSSGVPDITAFNAFIQRKLVPETIPKQESKINTNVDANNTNVDTNNTNVDTNNTNVDTNDNGANDTESNTNANGANDKNKIGGSSKKNKTIKKVQQYKKNSRMTQKKISSFRKTQKRKIKNPKKKKTIHRAYKKQ